MMISPPFGAAKESGTLTWPHIQGSVDLIKFSRISLDSSYTVKGRRATAEVQGE